MKKEILDLKEIYDIWPTPFYSTWLGIFLILTSIILGLIIIFLIIRFFKQSQLPFWKKAQFELKELEKIEPKNNEELKKVYERLTNILKNYIQKLYNLPKGVTDQEVLIYLDTHLRDLNKQLELDKLFEKIKFIKFSNYTEEIEQVKKYIVNSALFIEKTFPKNVK